MTAPAIPIDREAAPERAHPEHANSVPAPAISTSDVGRGGVAIHPLCVFLGLLALVLAVSERLLQDPDTHWHIALGRWIWTTGSVPWTDVFSHTFAGAPWIAKEWLSQLILYGAFATAGWRGVAVLAAIAIAGSFALLFAWLRRRLDPSVALAIAILAVVLSAGSFLARPHILVLPVVIAWTMGLVGGVERRTPPWSILPLMVLWANLHGSFPIAYVIAGLLAAEAVVSTPRDRMRAACVAWASFLGALALSGLATPYGYRAMAVALGLFGSGEPLPYITEWQPLALDPLGIAACAALTLALLGLSLRLRQNLFRILVVALLGYLMIRHVRFVSWFAVIAPIVAAGPLARRFPRWAASVRVAGREALPGIAPIGLALLAIGIGLVKSPGPSPLTTPTAALAQARAMGLTGPVYNDYDFGGLLIAEGVKTFIDGRTDQLFLDGFITRWSQALQARDDAPFAALLAKSGVTWALVKPLSDDARHLSALPGWRQVYEDAVAVIYRRE